MLRVKEPSWYLVPQPSFMGKVLWVFGNARGRGAPPAALGCKPVWELCNPDGKVLERGGNVLLCSWLRAGNENLCCIALGAATRRD